MISKFVTEAMLEDLKFEALQFLLEFCWHQQEARALQSRLDGAVVLFGMASKDGMRAPLIVDAVKKIARCDLRLYVGRRNVARGRK